MSAQTGQGGEGPFGMAEVFGAEFAALRPDKGYEAAADAKALFRMQAENEESSDEESLSALCISGGGIRSATFALGALQGLAKLGLLTKFDYLSTVSGGGYIGSWLTAWSHRAGGLAEVVAGLRPGARPKGRNEPDPIGHLRDYNNYLSPKLGAFSPDTWTLIATVLRNILLNWLVAIPILMAVLLVPRLFLSVLSVSELLHGDVIFANGSHFLDYRAKVLNGISESWVVSRVVPALCVGLLTMALFYTLRFLPGVGNQDHNRADYRLKILLPLIGAVLAFFVFDSLFYLGDNCHPSFSDNSSDNCEGPASLGLVVFWTLIPGIAAWVLYRLTPGDRNENRIPLKGRDIALAYLLMATFAGAATWASTFLLLGAWNWAAYVTFGPPVILIGYVLGTNLFVGLSSSRLADENREWMSSCVAGILVFCVGWTLLCGAVLLAPEWVVNWKSWAPHTLAVAGALSGWASAFGGSLAAPGAAQGETKPSKVQVVVAKLVGAAPAVFILVLAVGLSILTNYLLTTAHVLPGADLVHTKWLSLNVLAVDNPDVYGIYHAPVAWDQHDLVLTRSSPGLISLLLIVLIGISLVMSRFVNINTFSLSGMYRDRLVRAYLGASNPTRSASKFTGFSRKDDIAMGDLDPSQKPMHVLNLTLNLVESKRLAWQQRKAQSFTVTPLHCGNPDLGYRPASQYGGTNGMSLGTAVAISGAAASPSMGFRSNATVGFIMTLFNARLGAWLGNPTDTRWKRAWQNASPRNALRPMINEALGLTTNENDYVYLSDGGHFENLALYEMVQRRCRRIVLLDSGCDPDFTYEDLGNALRKIRIDFGIPIEFADACIEPLHNRDKRCAVATIRYSAVDKGAADGWLIYIKPMLLGSESPDVQNYGVAHPEFPHESTSDQWFSESQTESYRMLGFTTIEELYSVAPCDSLEAFRAHVKDVYLDAHDTDSEVAQVAPIEDPAPGTEAQHDVWSPDPERCGVFNLADLDQRGLKVRIAKWLFDDPQWWMGLLRRFWCVPRLPGDWAMITRFDHVQEALLKEDVFQVPFGPRMREMLDGPNFVLGMQGGPAHARGHKQIAQAFRPGDIDTFVARLCAESAQDIVARCGERLDAVEDLITRIPTIVCERYYGIPIPDQQKGYFAQWCIAMSGFMFGPPGKRPAFAKTAVAAANRFRPVLDGAIAAMQQAKERPDNVLARFVAMQEQGDVTLTDETIRAHLAGMITGFVPTNTIAAGNVLETLLNRPDVLARARAAALADDDALLQRYLFEAMRFKPINAGPFRVCSRDYVIGEGTPDAKLIRKGTKVMVSTQSAMFDERRVMSPTQFNPERERNDYMLFGYGLHWCIGAALAEAQVTQTFKPLLKRNGLRRAKGPAGQMERRSLFPVHLAVEFDA